MARRAALAFCGLVLALSLGGCMGEQAKEMFVCQSQASRFFPTYHAVDINAPSSQYIIQCMATKGYDFTIVPSDCDSKHPLPVQAACYTPHNWFAGLLDRYFRPLKSN
jgi:hypothetical protein